MRSGLFVPGDSLKKLNKAMGSGADAIFVDLEDSVSQDNKVLARDISAGFLGKSHRSRPVHCCSFGSMPLKLI